MWPAGCMWAYAQEYLNFMLSVSSLCTWDAKLCGTIREPGLTQGLAWVLYPAWVPA